MIPNPDRQWLAAFLDVRGRHALVAGGGEVAARKVEALLRSGARVTVVAPRLCEALAEWARAGAVVHQARRYAPDDLAGADLVVAATSDAAVNAGLAAAARERRLPVNVADDPAASTLILPAVIDRAPMRIAVTTEGASPVLARRVRTAIEEAVPPAFGRLAALAARHRQASVRRYPDPKERARFWEEVFAGPIGSSVLEGRDAEAEALLLRQLEP